MRATPPEGETLVREYLAGERTLLSWMRTGMNAIGIGILLYALIGLVAAISAGTASGAPDAFSGVADRAEEFRFFTLALVVFGGGVQVVAIIRFIGFRREMQRGVSTSSANVYMLVIFGFLLLAAAYALYVVVS